jgi:hypothetical protein
MDEQQLSGYDFSRGYAVCVECGRTDYLHEADCPVGSPARGLVVEEWPTFPVASWVRGVRQEDDLPTAEWLRRCGLGEETR